MRHFELEEGYKQKNDDEDTRYRRDIRDGVVAVLLLIGVLFLMWSVLL